MEAIKVHAFTSAENFAQFNNNYWASYPAPIQELLKNYQGQYKTYVNACCNKQTWLKMLNAAYCDFIKTNSGNTEFWTTIKLITKCEKLMFFNESNLILDI